jgi:hypothetical protein
MKSKLKSHFLFIAMGLLLCNSAQAVGTSFGDRDCGQWINRKSNITNKIYQEAWIAGYMTGLSSMNYLNKYEDDPLGKINSAEQIFLWMDNYCQKNPLQNLVTGGADLFIELKNKK